jgi:rubrerythrin
MLTPVSDQPLIEQPLTPSRRQFVRTLAATGVGGSAAVLAACGGGNDKSGTTRSKTEGDIAVLNNLLSLEYTSVAAYVAIASVLKGGAKSTANAIADQERQHANILTMAIEDLGGRANNAKSRGRYARGFPPLHTRTQALAFAVDVENTQVAAYIDAQPKLSTPDLRGKAAAIVTVEGEHLAVIFGEQRKPQAPKAFVTGGPPPPA